MLVKVFVCIVKEFKTLLLNLSKRRYQELACYFQPMTYHVYLQTNPAKMWLWGYIGMPLDI